MWSATIPFRPVSAPRPQFRKDKVSEETGLLGKHLSPFYSKAYLDYLKNVKEFLDKNELLNEEFYDVVNDRSGAVMEVDFFCPVPKRYTKVHHILKTSVPDIDNLLKAIMDGIFNVSEVRDSRVVGVIAWKYNTANNPRTEVKLKKISDYKKIPTAIEATNEWRATFNFKPVATPRPKSKTVNNSVITYYSKEYRDYLQEIRDSIIKEKMINQDLIDTMKSPEGVIAEIDYYYPVRKDAKNIKIMKTTHPDIDNLVKGTLDGIFTKDLPVRDSRVVCLIAFKYNVKGNPRTEVRLRSIS